MKHLFTFNERLKGWLERFATSATFASANFVGKESCESTVKYGLNYGLKSRITTTCLRLASVLTLICLLGVGNVWGASKTGTFTMKNTGQTSPVSNNGVTFTWSSSQIITGTNNGSGFKDKSMSGDADMVVTIPAGATLTGISKTNGNNWGGNASVKVYTGNNAKGTLIATISSGQDSYTISSNNTGTTYYLINNTGANAWINSLSITYTEGASCTAPTISAHPSNATYSVGDTPSNMSVTASGTTLTYQWYSNTSNSNTGGTIIAGQTNSTYTPSTASNGTFYYYCVVSSGSCSTSSNVATITVNKASATITLSEAGATRSVSGTHYGGDSYSLPTTTTASCGDKVLVGWSKVEVEETDTKPTSNYYEKGTSVTLAAGTNTFYAVFATASSGGTQEVNDALNRATTGVTGTDYSSWSNKTATSDAVYAGNSAGGNSSIQLRSNNSNSGVVTTSSGGKAKKVTVVWNSNTAGGRTLDIYGKNSAYSAASDLYGDNKGTKLGSIVYGTSTELTITGDYEYIGMRSNSGAMYLTSVTIKWEAAGGTTYSNYATSCTKRVTVTATAGGSATIDGEAAVDWVSDETVMNLVATPADGYVFAGWTSTGAEAVFDDASAASTTVITEGTATITANFVAAATISADKESLNLVAYVDEGEDETATITFTSSNAPQYGSVSFGITDADYTNDTYIIANPSSTGYLQDVNLNQTVTLYFGSDVAGSFSANLVATAYSTGNVVVGTKIIPITLTIKPKFSVTAVADVAAHATAISATPNADVKDGTTVTLSQTAEDGWIFQKWTISYTLNEVAHNEDLDGNTFTMPAANVTATAVYTEKTGVDLTAPANASAGSITSHSAVLSWDAVEHASSYSVYVVGTNYEETFDGITETSYTVTGLKAGITYSWTVTAIGDGEDYYTSSAANGAGFTTTARVLSSIAIKTDATKMTYNEGETFDKTGLEVTATYDDASEATISAASLVVPTTALTAGTTSITVSYTENAVEKTTTLNGITVNELGSVTWSANGVTNVVKYAEGAAISFPASASGCFGKSFVGWSESTIDGETDDAPTLVTSATMGATNKTYYAVFALLESDDVEKSYGFETSEPDASYWTVDEAIVATSGQGNGSSLYAGKINTNNTYITFKDKVNVTAFSFVIKRTSTNSNYNVYIETSADGEIWTVVKTVAMSDINNGSYTTVSHTFDGKTALYIRFHCYNTTAVRYVDDVHIAYSATTGSKYATSCCTPYTVGISNTIENGSVSTGDVTSACEGTEITLNASAAEGYEFGAWTVMQGEIDITESNVAGNVLTMPAGNVMVSASFNKIAVTGVTINGAENVQINNDVVWTLEITPAEARPTIVWSTAISSIATVSNGTVHGVAVGSTTITATVDGTPYNKTINVIRETKLGSIEVTGTPKAAYSLNEEFVAPSIQANYLYVDNETAAYSQVVDGATFTGFDNLNAGNQTITVSYGGKTTTYDVAVAAWTLKLQTKRMYGNDEIKEDVANVEVASLASPVDLTAHYVSGLCAGYEQIGYIASSTDVDALPNDLLTSYTPSANNETLYGVFKKVNYTGETLLTENFSDQEVYDANFPAGGRTTVTVETGYFRLGSGNGGGFITTKELSGLDHNFKVELKAKKYDNTKDANAQVCVTFAGTTKQSGTGLSTSTFNTYSFEFDGSELYNTVKIATLDQKERRIYVDDIRIYTLDDMEYMSVYDCREPKDVEYVIGNDKVVWTACENTTVMEGQEYTLCANEPSLQGYDFGGWIINGDEENVKAAGTSVEVAEDMTITPKFTEHVYDYSYALAASATNGTIASVTVNGIAKDLAEVALHDGDAVVVTATPNINYEFSEWTHSGNITSLTTDGNTASFTVAENAGDMTITAVFVEKAQYTITLNVFGRTYTTKQGHEGDSYSSVLAGAASPALTGYTFQGWSTDADDANAIISGEELLTADVTLYAIVGSLQPTGYVYHKVTSMGDITDDGYYLIVNEEFEKAFNGALSGKSSIDANGNKVNVTISENQIISNAEIDAAIVTIGHAENEGELYIKTASGYYIGASTNSTGLNANTTTPYGNIFSFEDGNFVVDGLKQVSDKELVLRFNSGAGTGRFGYYGGTQKPIQLYKRGEVHQEIIPEAEPEIEISTEVSASTSFPGGYVGDVTVVNGGSLNADINLSIGDLIIHSTLGKGTGTNTSGNAPGNCGQVVNGNNITVNGDVFLEIELTQDAAASAGWYAFSVPFPVDAMNGVYYGSTKLTNEVGYAIMSYHGDLRAQGLYGWKKYREIMQPGVLYIITVGDTDYKKLRFKKVAGADLAAGNTVPVKKYPLDGGSTGDNGWNGLGNPNLQISYYGSGYMHFLDHGDNAFKQRTGSNINLVVGSAFFIQYSGNDGSIVINKGEQDGAGGYLAPARERQAIESTIHEVKIFKGDKEEDNVFLTTSEDATNEYETGKDVAKLSMGVAKCAQMMIPAYGTNLCAADFPLVNGKAEYPLTITAPAAGSYRIEAAETYSDATIYLKKDGAIIWNLSMGAYEIELAQGTTEGYGLMLVRKVPGSATGVDEVQSDKVQCTKVVIDDHVYILRGGEIYDVTGKAVK